jgi:hypothetical protein
MLKIRDRMIFDERFIAFASSYERQIMVSFAKLLNTSKRNNSWVIKFYEL